MKHNVAVAAVIILILASPGSAQEKKMNVLVYPLKYAGPKEWSWLAEGMTDTVISDLAKVGSINVIADIDRKKCMEEIALGQSGVVDDGDMVKVGKFLGVNLIMAGSCQVLGDKIRVNCRLVTVETGAVSGAFKIDGAINPEEKIFDLQSLIVETMMAEASKIPSGAKKQALMTDQDRAVIKSLPKPNAKAFEFYSRGLKLVDTSLSEGLSCYEKALQIDKNYFHALMGAGYAAAVLGYPDKSKEYFQRAGLVLGKHGLEKGDDAAKLYSNMARGHWNRGDWARCVDYGIKAKEIWDGMGLKDTPAYLKNLNVLAVGNMGLKKYDMAAEYLAMAGDIAKLQGWEATSYYAFTVLNTGAVAMSGLNYDKAIEQFTRARDIWETIGMKKSWGVGSAAAFIGWSRVLKGDVAGARPLLYEGKQIFEDLKMESSFDYARTLMYIAYAEGVFGTDPCLGLTFIRKSNDLFKKQKHKLESKTAETMAKLEEMCKEK